MRNHVEWVKQGVTAAPGTGDILLGTAQTGFIALADSWDMIDGMLVEYTATDGSNRERGLARYDATNNKLVRLWIKAKLDGGVYGQQDSVGLTLTSNAVISCESVANDNEYPNFGLSGLSAWVPRTGTTVDSIGMTPNVSGTASAVTYTAGQGSFRKIRYTSATGAGAITYWQAPVADLNIKTSDSGGFVCEFLFNVADTSTNVKQFHGIKTSAANPASAADPSLITGLFGIGSHEDATNMMFYDNHFALGTPVDMGSDFPSGDVGSGYKVIVESGKDLANSLSITVKNISNNKTFHYSVIDNANMPLNWARTSWRSNLSSGGTTAALIVDYGAFVKKGNP